MSRGALLVPILLLTGCADPPASRPDPDPPVHRAAECRWAKSKIRIDGRHEESAWDISEELTGFSAFWDKKPGHTSTAARLLWDNDYLYFTADMEDYDLYADQTQHNGMLWLNDVFEIFLKPSANKPAYYEFEVSPNNTNLEMFLPSRGAGGYMRFAKLTNIGIETAVRRRGTLNNFHDKDGGWTVEGRIPWSGFQSTGGKPKPGMKWKFALCRFDYSWTLEQPEQTSTAPLTKPDFHRHEEYGDLTFVGPKK